MVEKNSPPMIVAAIEPNIASPSSGIIPRMVVSEAIITGRRRLWALTTSPAMRSVSPLHRWPISSNNTMQFLISMPINPNAPTMAQKSNVFPVSNIAPTMPTANKGMQHNTIVGLR